MWEGLSTAAWRVELLDPVRSVKFEIARRRVAGAVLEGLAKGLALRTGERLRIASIVQPLTTRGEIEDVTVLRENIKDLRASTASLMPEGLEESLSRQELADVISYLRSGL